jgi:hypothetical protein
METENSYVFNIPYLPIIVPDTDVGSFVSPAESSHNILQNLR